MAVTEFTVAISGAGKSYRRCAHFLATEYLPLKTGKIWTNFPIHTDEMVQYVVSNNENLVASDVVDRIKIIPEDTLKEWRAGTSGPWDYFKSTDIAGDRIAIDEIHNFCPKEASKEVARSWKEFLGEMRHRGVEFECLSQNEAKVHPIIKNEAGLKRTLFNTEDRRDPFFGVKMEDWYNLRAKFFTGVYTATVFEYEYLPLNGKWHQHATFKFSFKPEFYALYDSYSTPVAGGTKAKGKVYPFQENSKIRLLAWFFKRNAWHLLPRVLLVLVGAWVCFGGGGVALVNGFIGLQKNIMAANSKQPVAAPTVSTPKQNPPGLAVATASPVPASVKDSALVSEIKTASGTDAQKIEVIQAIENLQKENVDLKKEIEQAKKEVEKKSEIVLLGPTFVVFRDGRRYDMAEKILGGPYENKSFIEVNQRKRYARLSDGTIVPLCR